MDLLGFIFSLFVIWAWLEPEHFGHWAGRVVNGFGFRKQSKKTITKNNK